MLCIRIIYVLLIILLNTNFVHNKKKAELIPIKKLKTDNLTEIDNIINKTIDEEEIFKCSNNPPQRQVLSFEEVIADAEEEFEFNNATMIPMPSMVVFQRCVFPKCVSHNSRCCLQESIMCGPIDNNNNIVRLPFKITKKYLDKNGDLRKDQYVVFFSVKKHTKCDCWPSKS